MATITAHLGSGTRVVLDNERHHWLADEPFSEEGTDEGPTPYELLLGSLAACTAITIRVYARHKGIDLPWVRLAYEHSRDVIGEDGQPGELITAKVTIGGEYDDAQRARLAQIVTRCRVHKTLTNGLKIVDEVEFAPTIENPEEQSVAAGS
jgi:putative redox protein